MSTHRNRHDDGGGEAPRQDAPRTDVGMSLIEVLVAIVLLGTAGVAMLTALNASVRGSTNHEARAVALAELSAAASYLSSVRVESCADYAQVLAERPATLATPRATVSLVSVNCPEGQLLREVTLRATDQVGRAEETITLVLGGPTVIYEGIPDATTTTLPAVTTTTVVGATTTTTTAPPTTVAACQWGTVSVNPTEAVVRGNKLSQALTVAVSFSGDCSGRSLTATVTNGPASGDVLVHTMSQIDGLYTTAFGVDERNWKKQTNEVVVREGTTIIGTTTFLTK